MSVYDIDYDQLPGRLLPVRLRNAKHLSWLKALLSAVKTVYTSFMDYRTKSLYELRHNSQVCFMEAALNDAFDNEDRNIYIDDGYHLDPLWLAIDAEDDPLWLPLDGEDTPLWLPTEEETVYFGYDFIVYVPADISFDMNRLRAIVNHLKLPGMLYNVVTYTP